MTDRKWIPAVLWVIKALKTRGALTRYDVAKEVGISVQAASVALYRLEEAELAEWEPQSTGKKGGPRKLWSLT